MNSPQVKAYMEQMGFRWVQPRVASGFWWNEKDDIKQNEDDAMFFYQASIASTRKVLETVKRDVVGKDERWATNTIPQKIAVALATTPGSVEYRNELRTEQRQKLDEMIEGLL